MISDNQYGQINAVDDVLFLVIRMLDLQVLDREELDAALAQDEITDEQYALAVRELEKLIGKLEGHEPEWRALCAREKARLEQKMAEKGPF